MKVVEPDKVLCQDYSPRMCKTIENLCCSLLEMQTRCLRSKEQKQHLKALASKSVRNFKLNLNEVALFCELHTVAACFIVFILLFCNHHSFYSTGT